MQVIDLTQERAKREEPDSGHVMKDEFGRPMFSFLLDYQAGDDEWSTTIWAYDHEDAERRVRAMRDTLVVAGQIFSTI